MLIPNEVKEGNFDHQSGGPKGLAVKERFMRYQLVGEVMAHQG